MLLDQAQVERHLVKVSQWSFICATANMWHKTLPILLLILAVSAVQVEDDQQGYVDEENEAFVIEG